MTDYEILIEYLTRAYAAVNFDHKFPDDATPFQMINILASEAIEWQTECEVLRLKLAEKEAIVS